MWNVLKTLQRWLSKVGSDFKKTDSAGKVLHANEKLKIAASEKERREDKTVAPSQKTAATPQRKKPQRKPAQVEPILPRMERTLVIGVDYGTSSTKVVWQDLSDNHFESLKWQSSDKGLRALLLPSTIIIRNGRLLFGLPDEGVREGDFQLPSIKICILCENKSSMCCCQSSVARNGIIRFQGKGYPASTFACLFLAHVFGIVETRLKAQFPNDDLILLWNIGCPMDYLDKAGRKSQWEKMTGTAMTLHQESAELSNSALLGEVTARVATFSVPPREERNYFVQPEGLAAVKAFLESPHSESKTYAIVDVGAGTTEVSFFFNGQIMTEPGWPLRPSYLSDSTRSVGGVRIDLELARAWGCEPSEARRRKHAGEQNLPALESVTEICSQYEHTCWDIVRANKLVAAHDKRFDLFVIGGGGRLHTLRNAVNDQRLPGGFIRENVLALQPPRMLAGGHALKDDYDFIANACGLASSLSWEYYPPSEVGGMSAPRLKPRIDRDELYPK